MAGKKKTTFTKMARESKLRERRMEKQAKKDARKQAGGLQQEEITAGLHHQGTISEISEQPAGDAPRSSDATGIGAV